MSLIDEKNKVLRNSTDDFLKSLKKLERSIYILVLAIIEALDTSSGQLVDSGFNLSAMLRLSSQLEDAFRQSTLSQRVRNWVRDFDQVVDLQKQYWASQGAPF